MHELQTLSRRYGKQVSDPAMERLLMTRHRNRARREVIEEQLGELSEELRRLRIEDQRLELMMDVLSRDLAEAIRHEMGEGWSPTPVVGYRLWRITGDVVAGATGHPWPGPVMDATCDRARPDDDLPHTDHVCSRVGYGCGIYAATDPGRVASDTGSDWVLGIVLLSGKVVEHEHGYRAAHARVAGVVARAGGRTLITSDADLLEALFAAPAATVALRGHPEPSPNTGAISVALEGLEREIEAWT